MTATGIGSLPFDDIDDALRLVFDELPDLPHLPELPGRGVGADLIGRTAAAVLVDLHADLQPAGWRLIDGRSHDETTARELLARDLEALQVQAHGYEGLLKLQVAGPWTLAASLELSRGDKVLGDAGAVRDLIASLAEGVRAHLEAVAALVPAAQLVLQLDEPSLPMVLAGRVATASGYRAFPPVDEQLARDGLRTVLAHADAAVQTAVHCCAPQPPIRLLVSAGASAVSVDASLLTERDDDSIGELVEAGRGLWLGLVPSLGPGVPPTVASLAAPARALWSRLGFPAEQLAEAVTVTPTCGMAGASTGWARTALGLARRTALALADDPEPARVSR